MPIQEEERFDTQEIWVSMVGSAVSEGKHGQSSWASLVMDAQSRLRVSNLGPLGPVYSRKRITIW